MEEAHYRNSERGIKDMLNALHGHCLTKLRELPTGSVHVWVTSPPYWGLRDYGVEPQIWGGDDKCEHEWGKWSESHSEREKTSGGKSRTNQRTYGDDSTPKFNGNHQKHTAGAFCSKCDAWLGSLGLEPNPDLYVRNLVLVLREARRVLRDEGTLWLNLGDSYAGSRSGEKSELPHYDGRDYDAVLKSSRVAVEPGQNILSSKKRIKNLSSKQATNSASDFPGAPHRGKMLPRGPWDRWGGGNNPAGGVLKPKDLVGIPWMVAFALRADGWWLRSRIPWIKRNCMPESCDDRPSTAIEDVFLLSKSARYFYDAEAVAVPASLATHARLAQNVEAQIGNARANGGARVNGNMRATGRKMAAPGSGIRNNEDFNNAVCLMVSDRNRRNSDWFMDSFQGLLSNEFGEPLALIINTQPFAEAHFATFPPRLIQPMILAGTSARGCCSSCGAPWERVTETGAPDLAHQRAYGSDADGDYTGEATKDFESARAQNASQVKARILRGMNDQKTVGWIPTCKCAGYAVQATTSRRMACERRDIAAHDVDANTKSATKSNAGRLASLRDSARAGGNEYGSAVVVDRQLNGDQLDFLNVDKMQLGPSTTLGMTNRVSNSARARRRKYYREKWQERINAKFPKTVPCVVGDMFGGSGTSGEVALELGRRALLIELSEEYLPMIHRRCDVTPSMALA